MKPSFKNARFVGSAMDHFPSLRTPHGNFLPEVAIVGRSNVGKSSLINHLLQNKNLARVSSSPGKTQTINFFNVDDALALVDLPGYGYAKRPGDLRKTWAQSIDHYFQTRSTLKLICLLIDSRRRPTEDDLQFVSWARYFQKPILIIFTKSDTLSPLILEKNKQESLALLGVSDGIYYSIKDGKSRQIVIEKIKEVLWGN